MKHVSELYAMDATDDLLAMIQVLERIKDVSNITVSFDRIEHQSFWSSKKVGWIETVFKLEYDHM